MTKIYTIGAWRVYRCALEDSPEARVFAIRKIGHQFKFFAEIVKAIDYIEQQINHK